jgi:hypothetical protein
METEQAGTGATEAAPMVEDESCALVVISKSGIENWPADRKAKLATYLKSQGFH